MGTTAIEWLEPKETTFHDAVVAAGDGTEAVYNSKYTALLLEVTIAGTATITPKAKIMGGYVNIPATNRNTDVTALTITASGLYLLDITGAKSFIADITSWGSGAVTAIGRAVAIPMPQARVTLVGDSTVAGDVAHDAADSGKPVKIGYVAESTIPAAVADGDRVNAAGTLYGAAFVNPVTNGGTQMSGLTGAAVTAAAMLVGGTAAGIFRAIGIVNTDQQKVTPYSSTGVEGAAGDVAHGAADAGNPVKTGGKATAAAPAAVDEGDRVGASFTLTGSQRMEVTGSLPAFAATPTVDTELPAAAALADSAANFTTPTVGAAMSVFHGAGGTWGRMRADSDFMLFAKLRDASGAQQLPNAAALADAAATPTTTMVGAALEGFNNVTWDRWRNNTEGTLLVSAARTVATTASVLTNYNAKGILIILQITVASGTGGLVPKIRSVDPISGLMVQLNANFTPIIATGTYGFEIYPGASTAAPGSTDGWLNQRTAGAIARTVSLLVTPGDASSYTYSVSYALIL